MKTIRHLLTLAMALAAAQIASAASPSAINYQGRLTNSEGVPQSGSKTMSLKIYDAATSGTLLYSESMGSVGVDANGVYSFQFGATGSSNTLVSETIATTDGSSLTYQKALANTPVVAGSVSVTDGTYSWNELTGNPGSLATATSSIVSGFVVGAAVTNGGSGYTSTPTVTITGNGSGAAATASVSGGAVTAINITSAGSGYTTGATVTIAPPPAPFVVNYTGGTITATYADPPASGKTITATYRYSASGITGALASGAEQWLELSVDGVAQSPRQKVLAVPFALTAQSSLVAQTALSAQTALHINEDILAVRTDTLSKLIDEVAVYGSSSSAYRLGNNFVEPSTLQLNAQNSTYTTASSSRSVSATPAGITIPANGPVSTIVVSALTGGSPTTGHVDYYFRYIDGTSTYAGFADASSFAVGYPKTLSNPMPGKSVASLSATSNTSYTYPGSCTINYSYNTERWMDVNLDNLPANVTLLRCYVMGSTTSTATFNDCLLCSIGYTDGTYSERKSQGSDLAVIAGKTPKRIRINTIPSILGTSDLTITKTVIRIVTK
jgi:hypothetical protein